MIATTWSCKTFDELSLNELYQILQLRQEVFIVEQDCPYLDADDKDQKSSHQCAYDSTGDLIAYTRLVPKGVSYEKYISIGRVLTAQKARGKGLGRPLMHHSIENARKLFGESPIKISAQNHLRKYYNSLGFISVGDVYDEDGIPHIAMILE